MRRSLRVTVEGLIIAAYAYLFFLAIGFMGSGMKASFKAPVHDYLHEHAEDFNELVSFVIGLLGTSLIQSSSTVTSMAVTLTTDGVIPLIIAVGIVHGANLGTSVTSIIVGFATDLPKLTGNPLRDLAALLVRPRSAGYRRAVGTAVVHDMFNIIMVTSLLLLVEIPFGAIRGVSAEGAHVIGGALAGGELMMEVFHWVSPKTYTTPVYKLFTDNGLYDVPGWLMAIAGLALLFGAIKGFATRVKKNVLHGEDESDLEALGHKLLGKTAFDTFLRGLILTIMIQSSSATTSMVVPLAAMGMFRVKKIFPFIMGANIGTTTTALIAASANVGEPGFEAGMTIALSHFMLNTVAVALVAGIPPLQTTILGAAELIADLAARWPGILLLYLATLMFVVPAIVYFLPYAVALGFMSLLVLILLIGPHLYLRSQRAKVGNQPVALGSA